MTPLEEFEVIEEEFLAAFSRWKGQISAYASAGVQFKVPATDNQSNVVDEELVATVQNLNAIKADFQGPGKAEMLQYINRLGQIDITNV